MRYHSIKMTEVNAIIKEMWEATYTGGGMGHISLLIPGHTQ